MAKIGFKTVLIIAFLISSSISLPLMVSGQEYGVSAQAGTPDGGMMGNPSALWGGMGQAMGMFGKFGPAGDVLGQILMILFMQGLDISSREMLPGVFVLNASIEDTRDWDDPLNETYDKRRYWVPWRYIKDTNINGAYCVIEKEGSIHYNFTSGAVVTFIIWDSDGSLIDALQRIIDMGKKIFNTVKKYEVKYEYSSPTESELEEMEKEMMVLVGEAVSVISYLLIHINDIINGDELIMLNPITYQSLLIETSADFKITKRWYYTDGSEIPAGLIDGWGWEDMADDHNDEYMQWLLSEHIAGIRVKKWTHFTFDLIQLWIKNFHVEIDANAIMQLLSQAIPTGNGGGGEDDPSLNINPAAIFEGCDIEFYLFTHHLAGAFLFDDKNDDGKITVEYVNVTDEYGDPIIVNNTNVQVPNSTEVTHRIHLGAVNDFDVKDPEETTYGGAPSISWGLQMNDVNLSAVPLGVNMEDYIGDVDEENLDFIFFGFTFIPNIADTVDIVEDGVVTKTIQLASGKVKLDQYFAPWNDGAGPNSNITDLDMAIIYLSTALHIHLNMSLAEIPEDRMLLYNDQEDRPMLTENDYHEEEHALYIGNYMPGAEKVPFVDIAGPYYVQGADEETGTQYPASTSIIPLGLFEAGVSDFSTHIRKNDTTQSFTSEGFFQTDFNVMLYSVNYPMFNGTGEGLFHDPVFSVFMTWEAQSIISIVLLLGGITLIGVATILITRRKNKLIR